MIVGCPLVLCACSSKQVNEAKHISNCPLGFWGRLGIHSKEFATCRAKEIVIQEAAAKAARKEEARIRKNEEKQRQQELAAEAACTADPKCRLAKEKAEAERIAAEEAEEIEREYPIASELGKTEYLTKFTKEM
jgi:hypothetical protein